MRLLHAGVNIVAHPSKGYCSDWKYLPEGGYPARLDSNANPLEECAQRCIAAADADSEYSKDAFYVRDSNQHCACSKGACSDITSGSYTSVSYTHLTLPTILLV